VASEQYEPDDPVFDVNVPHVARMYNYWLDGRFP